MRPSLRAFGTCLLLIAAGCTDARGAPGSLGTTYGFNVVVVPAPEREPAPPFSGEAVRPGEGPVSSALFSGTVGIVNFWGSWCGPCRREQPLLERLWKEYRPRGVRFVGVNTRRDARANAIAFLDEFGVTYPSVYDPDSRIAFSFGVRVMPATYVIDRDGRIAAFTIGAFRTEADLRRLLDVVLEAGVRR